MNLGFGLVYGLVWGVCSLPFAFVLFGMIAGEHKISHAVASFFSVTGSPAAAGAILSTVLAVCFAPERPDNTFKAGFLPGAVGGAVAVAVFKVQTDPFDTSMWQVVLAALFGTFIGGFIGVGAWEKVREWLLPHGGRD